MRLPFCLQQPAGLARQASYFHLGQQMKVTAGGARPAGSRARNHLSQVAKNRPNGAAEPVR
jgi:hypothetical protein